MPCGFKSKGNKISVLEVIKVVVNNLYLKLSFYPLVIRKRISNCLYKLIDGKDDKETEEMRCDFPENYHGEFLTVILLRDLPNISEVIAKAGFKPPFPDFFNYEYEKRFNCDIWIMLSKTKEEFKDTFRYKDSETEKKINILKGKIKQGEFICDQANEEGLCTKEVINDVKNALKMVLDNLEANKEINEEEIFI